MRGRGRGRVRVRGRVGDCLLKVRGGDAAARDVVGADGAVERARNRGAHLGLG